MSTANAKKGSAIESQEVQAAARPAPAHHSSPGPVQDQGTLLAQIPDLDPKTAPIVCKKAADGRIISQALSTKLIFGLGLVLVVGAILPFVFGKISRPGPAVTELPVWSSNGGSTGVASNTAQTMAPMWSPSPSAPTTSGFQPHTATTQAPAILSPQPQHLGDSRPAALSEPPWSPVRPLVAAEPATGSWSGSNNNIQPPAANSHPSDNRADYRGFEPRPGASAAADPRNLQADSRNDPAAQYRNEDSRYDYRGNPIEPTPVRRDLPAGGYLPDTRYDNSGRANPPAAGPGSPLMPWGAAGTRPGNSDPQSSEAGVARFDGTIVTPPARTSYDRTGSSNN